MKLHTMSKNVVDIMIKLGSNEMLSRILSNDVIDPYRKNADDTFYFKAPLLAELVKPDSSTAKIFPYPFDPDAITASGTFIRVYYNDGEFNENETIAESALHIDIITSKDLWLIRNDRNESLIRPYDIMGRVIELVGRNSVGTGAKLKFSGYQHMYINTKFDCIRLYAEYMSVEK